MAQNGLRVNDKGEWENYEISDSSDTGWNESIINAKLEKNVDLAPKRSIFTADTVTNEVTEDPYKGAYDDYIPWWLQNGSGDSEDIDTKNKIRPTKELSPYEEVFGKPTLGAQTFDLTGKNIHQLYAERDKPDLTLTERFKKSGLSLTGTAVSLGIAKWKDQSLELEIKRREASNLKLHGKKDPTVEESLGSGDRDTGAEPGGQTPLKDVTIGGKSATDIGARRGQGGTIITKDKPYEGPTGGDAEEGGGGTRASYSGEVSQVGVGRQDPEGGGNGGSNGGGCVVATHAVNAGVFDLSTKRQAIRWCVKNLHRTWWGEAIRKGYRYYGQKAIDQGTVKNHYQEFKNYLAFATGRKRNLKNAWTFFYRTIQFFIKGITI